VSESSSQASLKEEFTTPPDSPINTRKTQLKKEPSFDRFSQSPPTSPVLKAKLSDASKDGRLSPGSAGRFSQSPPTSPVLKAKLSDASKDGRLSPGSAGLREGHLSTSHGTVPARRDSFGSPPTLPGRKESVGSPIPQRRESFGSPRHSSPVRTIRYMKRIFWG